MIRAAMPEEFESALRRCFVERHADYWLVTSRRDQFGIEAGNFGIERGWLEGRLDTRDEQSTAWICRLTDKGREHFGL